MFVSISMVRGRSQPAPAARFIPAGRLLQDNGTTRAPGRVESSSTRPAPHNTHQRGPRRAVPQAPLTARPGLVTFRSSTSSLSKIRPPTRRSGSGNSRHPTSHPNPQHSTEERSASTHLTHNQGRNPMRHHLKRARSWAIAAAAALLFGYAWLAFGTAPAAQAGAEVATSRSSLTQACAAATNAAGRKSCPKPCSLTLDKCDCRNEAPNGIVVTSAKWVCMVSWRCGS